MNLLPNSIPCSHDTPTGLPSHDNRQYLHLQPHDTQRFCTIIDSVFILLSPKVRSTKPFSVIRSFRITEIPELCWFQAIWSTIFVVSSTSFAVPSSSMTPLFHHYSTGPEHSITHNTCPLHPAKVQCGFPSEQPYLHGIQLFHRRTCRKKACG